MSMAGTGGILSRFRELQLKPGLTLEIGSIITSEKEEISSPQQTERG